MRLMSLPEQDVGGLRLWNVMSYCVERFYLKPKWDVYDSNVRPSILHGRKARCLKENKMGNLGKKQRSTVKEMCEVQLKNRKRAIDLMLLVC